MTTLVLGLDPVAAAATGYIAAFYGYFQHMNIRTPRWLGFIIQRPEAHCVHHQRDVHAYNYGDLPVWDMLFGTFRNPAISTARSASTSPRPIASARCWSLSMSTSRPPAPPALAGRPAVAAEVQRAEKSARQDIASSSSIMPAITDSPLSQNLGSLASSPNGWSSSE